MLEVIRIFCADEKEAWDKLGELAGIDLKNDLKTREMILKNDLKTGNKIFTLKPRKNVCKVFIKSEGEKVFDEILEMLTGWKNWKKEKLGSWISYSKE